MTFDLIRWLRNAALPLWATTGFDSSSGLFVERLDLRGHPLIEVPRRAMVQARQIFVFAQAHERGWHAGASMVEQAGEALLRAFRIDGEPGWVFSVGPDGRVHDTTRDLYAQAFVLFALAWLKRLTGRDLWLDLADATLRFMDDHMATPGTGGYCEAVPRRAGPRRQNPHMHLFEAFLALDAAGPDRGYRQRADQMVELLAKRFLHGPRRVLVELYDDALRPRLLPPFAFEPGHHFEWTWLLAAAGSSDGSTADLALALWETAADYGIMENGIVVDEVSGDGCPLTRTTRLWPQAEALRASTLDINGRSKAQLGALSDRLLDTIHERFLVPTAAGCWIDQLDADARPTSPFVPASSLYHIVAAATALSDTAAVMR